MAPRLKVFTWSDGFHAFTVATTSRPKALQAFGSKQDLFATGLASELSDGPDYKAALKSPGEVVQRGLAIDVGKIEKAPRRRTTRAPTAAQRRRVEALAERLAALDVAHETEMADLEKEEENLRRRRAAAETAYEKARREATDDLKAARAKM
ncbi:hypothetical protein [Brevundimonas sp.]|uniref:hypothetical protein n=1 Tax=Brevundimonas sp. TaxID=1871086 RepID=UPI0019AA6E05|nr:hypothetical protein [Brevundimonas sp.]MBD3836801.1 hypothetical protein [Brevundimonas sp.]